MNKRQFLKAGLVAGLATQLPFAASAASASKRKKIKNWVWVNPNLKDTDADLETRYTNFKAAGITGIFFENDSERHFRAAKKHGLEAHRWIWTMNRAELITINPEWYARNRNGDSCADKPPYVNYYHWLCPSRPEVKEYLQNQVDAILSKDYVDGIHLDYVRYCDVCRTNFKAQYGTDVSDIQYPEASLSWRLFRYHNITNIVNGISAIAKQHKKSITAAVFPTPEIARRNVRQDWTNWKLDGVCPMTYHGFYKEKPSWIGNAVAEGIHFLAGEFPLYAGLYLPDFKSDDELREGISAAFKNGASGVSFFGNVTDAVLSILSAELKG